MAPKTESTQNQVPTPVALQRSRDISSNEELSRDISNDELSRDISNEELPLDNSNEELESIDTNHDLLNRAEPFEPAINIPENLYHNIKLKLKSLSNRDKILQIKLGNYQKKNENLNMFIIFVSSILGIYETFRVKIDDVEKTPVLDVGANVVPIFLSGIITCTASIIKLKKYQEKSDNIHLTREKVSVARSNLKTVQEHLLFCKSTEELEKIQKIYFKTTFDSYCNAQSYLDRHVKEIDYLKYGHKINYSDGYCVEDDDEEDELEQAQGNTQALGHTGVQGNTREQGNTRGQGNTLALGNTREQPQITQRGNTQKSNASKKDPKLKTRINMNESYDFRKSRESSVTYKSPDIENQTVIKTGSQTESLTDSQIDEINDHGTDYESSEDSIDSEQTDRHSISQTNVSVEEEKIVPK